jgi:enoyl-CoA hydratase
MLYQKQDEVIGIRFNRPHRLNAINEKFHLDYIAALHQARRETDAKVVLIEGEGTSFCAGADLKEIPRVRDTVAGYREEIYQTRDIFNAARALDKPMIAAIQGYCLGGGLEYALHCDIRIAAENAEFGFPEVAIGTAVAGAGTQLLARTVGLGRAKEMILTGSRIDAQKAYMIGLVNMVVPIEKLHDAAMDLARKLAANSKLAVAMMKCSLDHAFEASSATIMDLEIATATTLFGGGERQRLMSQKAESISAKKHPGEKS